MIHPSANLFGDYYNGSGNNNKIGAFCDIGGVIGSNCKIQCHVSIPPLTIIGDNVFIGPGVHFANDKLMDGNMKGTIVKDGVKIGAGSIIGAGLIIGKNAVIGMGSVVTKDIPEGEVWYGNPATMKNNI